MVFKNLPQFYHHYKFFDHIVIDYFILHPNLKKAANHIIKDKNNPRVSMNGVTSYDRDASLVNLPSEKVNPNG